MILEELPPLVRRCNVTTAGLGYLEVIRIELESSLSTEPECPHYHAVGYGHAV
jgi:hypothetical protein